MTATVMAQHLLALILIAVAPLMDHFDIKKLKAGTDPKRKLHYYRKIIVWLWALAAVACAAVGLRLLFTINASAGGVSWLSGRSWVRIVVAGVVAALIGLIFLPAVQAMRNEKVRAAYTKATRVFSFFLPVTVDERRWWFPVSISAGVCEEVLYRGFLPHYFHASAFHLGLIVALVISSIVFGMAHLYQGMRGVIESSVMGFIFGIIFILTGSLLIPIAIHAATDLRLLVLLQPGAVQAEAGR
jgi:uncharacterized protein